MTVEEKIHSLQNKNERLQNMYDSVLADNIALMKALEPLNQLYKQLIPTFMNKNITYSTLVNFILRELTKAENVKDGLTDSDLIRAGY